MNGSNSGGEQTNTTQGLSLLLSGLSTVVTAATSLSGIAYLIGWVQLNAYFSRIGAPWAISMLSVGDVIKASASQLAVMLASAAISILFVMDKELTAHGARRIALGLMIISVSLSGAAALFPWSSVKLPSILLLISNLILSCFLGVLIAEMVARFSDRKIRWNDALTWLVIVLFQYALWITPRQVGDTQATMDASPSESTLSPVLLMEEDDAGYWRLLARLEGKLVLVHLSENRDDRIFRIVEDERVAHIRSK